MLLQTSTPMRHVDLPTTSTMGTTSGLQQPQGKSNSNEWKIPLLGLSNSGEQAALSIELQSLSLYIYRFYL